MEIADKRVRLFDRFNPSRSCYVLCHGSYMVGCSWWITRRQFEDAKNKICLSGSYLCFDADTLPGEDVIVVVDVPPGVCGWIKAN